VLLQAKTADADVCSPIQGGRGTATLFRALRTGLSFEFT
jgi:hypothetical protein